MIRLLQFLVVVLLVRVVFRALASWLGGPAPTSMSNGSPADREPVYRGWMVRDPVCGVHIPQQGSIPERRGGVVHYFCSEACREAFRKNKVAAK